MLYFGRVTRVDDAYVYCIIDDLGGQDYEFGPLPIIEWTLDDLTTYTDTRYAHIYHSHTATLSSDMTLTNPWHNDETIVVVAQIGLVKEDLVVLGSIPWGKEHD
jgi:hypothetical protein